MNDADAVFIIRIPVTDLPAAIDRTIIDQYEFHILICLQQNAVNTLFYIFTFIINGHDHTDLILCFFHPNFLLFTKHFPAA